MPATVAFALLSVSARRLSHEKSAPHASAHAAGWLPMPGGSDERTLIGPAETSRDR